MKTLKSKKEQSGSWKENELLNEALKKDKTSELYLELNAHSFDQGLKSLISNYKNREKKNFKSA